MRFLGYVDPGTGQLIWQMLVAMVVGILFYVKRFRDFLSRLVAKMLKRD